MLKGYIRYIFIINFIYHFFIDNLSQQIVSTLVAALERCPNHVKLALWRVLSKSLRSCNSLEVKDFSDVKVHNFQYKHFHFFLLLCHLFINLHLQQKVLMSTISKKT